MNKSTMQLSKLIKIGDNDNININEYWCETEEAVLEIKDAPQFSKAILVTEIGRKRKLYYAQTRQQLAMTVTTSTLILIQAKK